MSVESTEIVGAGYSVHTSIVGQGAIRSRVQITGCMKPQFLMLGMLQVRK
jgi:hypothetical protein